MRNLEVEDIGADGNVIFATDENMAVEDGEQISSARMFSPRAALNWCQQRDDDLADLLVQDARSVNLRSRPEGGFEIAPSGRIEGAENVIGKEIADRGSIPLTDQAVDQLCGLMNRGRSFKRGYGQMQLANRQFILDFKSRFGNRDLKDDSKGLIFRTSTETGIGRRAVEGIIPASADRTNENRMVRRAMAEIMKAVGSGVHGIEFVHDPSHCTRSFRIVFGQSHKEPQAIFDRGDHTGDWNHGHIYPMLDITLSAAGRVVPSAAVGLYRVLCRNTAMDDLFPMVNWRGSEGMTWDSFDTDMQNMAQIAVPYCDFLAGQLMPCYDRKLENSYHDTLGRLVDLGCIGKSHAGTAEDFINNEVGEIGHFPEGDDGSGGSEWGLFNVLTDAAKLTSTIEGRRKAERNALTCLIAGGFDKVCGDGLNRRKLRAGMVEAMKGHRVIGPIMARHETEREAALEAVANN